MSRFTIGLSCAKYFALAACLGLFGCDKKVAAANDLSGPYFADYGFAKETLELSSDRRFVQKIKILQSGQIVTSSGTWWFVPEDSDVCFSVEFLVVSDGFGRLAPNFEHPARKAISVLPVRGRSGKVQIGLDPRVPYRKQLPGKLPEL